MSLKRMKSNAFSVLWAPLSHGVLRDPREKLGAAHG
jgi:hypothetical protein